MVARRFPSGIRDRTREGMRATEKRPAQERPIFYRAVGLQAAREAANMSRVVTGEGVVANATM